MKQNQLIETANVTAARSMIDYLLHRPVAEMVGMGMIYGPPGLGKSRFILKEALERGWVYLRLESTMTAKAFLLRLVELILHKSEGRRPPRASASANELLRWIIHTLTLTKLNIAIDEIDYAFGNKKLLGAIRDIVDETFSIIVLVGMADAKERLARLDAHYFDRCAGFVKFKPLKQGEACKLLGQVSDIKLTQQQRVAIYDKSGGKHGNNLRRMNKHLRSEENKAELKQAPGSEKQSA